MDIGFIIVIEDYMIIPSPLSVNGKATRRINVELGLGHVELNRDGCAREAVLIGIGERAFMVNNRGWASRLHALSAGVEMALCSGKRERTFLPCLLRRPALRAALSGMSAEQAYLVEFRHGCTDGDAHGQKVVDEGFDDILMGNRNQVDDRPPPRMRRPVGRRWR
jgi:hypothetical protein